MLKVNGELFGSETFHNGEVIYKGVQLDKDSNIIDLRFENNCDITNLLMAEKYIRDKEPYSEVVLNMMYIPYSRMDREIPEGGQLFSLKYFADIINGCNFDKVNVLDPHSDVSTQLLNKIKSVNLIKYLPHVVDEFKPDYLFFPDKGANNKYTELSSIKTLCKVYGLKTFYGTKKRDLANKGKLIEEAYELHNIPEDGLDDKRILIIDDLVSMGGTAYMAAKALKFEGAGSVALYATHCENGVFYGKLLKPEAVSHKGTESAVNDLPWAGGYTVDKVYTIGTTPLEHYSENLVVVE